MQNQCTPTTGALLSLTNPSLRPTNPAAFYHYLRSPAGPISRIGQAPMDQHHQHNPDRASGHFSSVDALQGGNNIKVTTSMSVSRTDPDPGMGKGILPPTGGLIASLPPPPPLRDTTCARIYNRASSKI